MQEKKLHGDKLCVSCYHKRRRKEKRGRTILCPRCQRTKLHGAKGFCMPCYQTTFHLDRTKQYRIFKEYNLKEDIYKKITNKCLLCNFKHIVDIHHLDKNHKNNDLKNLIGLCPNHHKLIHTLKHRERIERRIRKKLK